MAVKAIDSGMKVMATTEASITRRDDQLGPSTTAKTEKSGSYGEHALQKQYGTTKLAEKFYNQQMLNHLNRTIQEFINR